MRAALALGLLVACGPPPPMGTCELKLGSSLESGSGFVPMPMNATLVPGAQGGFHVWLSYRVKDAPAAVMKASHTVRRLSDNKLLSRGERKLQITAPGDDGFWQTETATPAFLCPTPLGVSAIDVDAVFEVVLTDPDGKEAAKDRVQTKLVCPTDSQQQFCQMVCAG